MNVPLCARIDGSKLRNSQDSPVTIADNGLSIHYAIYLPRLFQLLRKNRSRDPPIGALGILCADLSCVEGFLKLLIGRRVRLRMPSGCNPGATAGMAAEQ